MNILAKFCGKKYERDPQRERWLNELEQVKNEMDGNDMLFNMTDDYNLTEYAIHKKAALEARYSYLMRLIRRYDEACVNKPGEADDNAVGDVIIRETEMIAEDDLKNFQR